MELSKGQLFTIEALNMLEKFVWPDGMNYAYFNCAREIHVTFSDTKPVFIDKGLSIMFGSFCKHRVNVRHPYWKASIITREEFEKVDGWIQYNGEVHNDYLHSSRVDLLMQSRMLLLDGNMDEIEIDSDSEYTYLSKWRYHKDSSSKMNVQPGSDDSSFEDINIVSIYSEYGKLVSDIETMTARKAELLEIIKAYNLAHSIEVKEF